MFGGDGAFAVFFILFAAVIVAGLVWGAYAARERRKQLLEFATSIGWTYQSNANQLVGRWRGQPFNVGDSRKVPHLLTGDYRGRTAASFEYQYTTGSGKSRSTSTFTVAMLNLPAYLPDLEITNEGLGATLSKFFGGQDIQFESEEFNRRWRVEASVLKTAHDIVHPRFMEFMNAGPQDPMRFEGTDVWSWHIGPLRPDQIQPRLARLAAAVDLVPRHVWQDFGHDPVDPPTLRS